MKAAAPARTKHGPFKTMPLRWSFGPREKRAGASAELVEYLESRRRPRSTSQSIVPLLTGAAGGDEKSASPRPNGTASAKAEDGGGASERALSTVPCPQGHPCPGPVPGNPARKLKDHASQDIRLPKKFDLPLAVMPSMESERPARPEGQRGTSWKGSGHVGSQSSPPSPSTGLSRDNRDSRRDPTAKAGVTAGDAEQDRPFQGTRTLLRSVFWKKENRRIDVAEGSPPPGSGRLSPAVDLQARGSSPTLRDVQSAPSSLHLPRKASRPPRGSALGVAQRFVSGEQTPCGTLQRVKYHTLSLGRKKSLPESSF